MQKIGKAFAVWRQIGKNKRYGLEHKVKWGAMSRKGLGKPELQGQGERKGKKTF